MERTRERRRYEGRYKSSIYHAYFEPPIYSDNGLILSYHATSMLQLVRGIKYLTEGLRIDLEYKGFEEKHCARISGLLNKNTSK